MNTPLLPALLVLLAAPLAAMEPTPGFVSTNQSFAVRNGTAFSDSNLDAYEGKILVIMMMTPWCPFCQGNAIAVGDGVLNHYNDPARGSLRGKTDQGVEIVGLLLSTEPASTWDATNSSFAAANGYQQWGLDADANRLNPRVLLGYYRGGFINSSNLYNWGNDRRRVTILNLVKNSPSHIHRSVLFNQNNFDSAQNTSVQAAINAVLPAPATMPPASVSFSQWTVIQGLSSIDAEPLADPDADGVPNLLEFYHGSPALSPGREGVGLSLLRDATGWKLGHQRARNIGGLTVEYLFSTDLVTWGVLALPEPSVAYVGDVQWISHALPEAPGTPRFYRLRVTAP